MKHDLMKDDVIKKIFTSQRCGKRLSAAIISRLLNVDEKLLLNNLEFIHPNIANNKISVNSVADLVLEDNTMIVNIEFNYTKSKSINIKNGSYIVQLCIRQLNTFKNYEQFKPVIQINIDNYDYFGKNKFLYRVKLMETKLHLTYSDNIQVYHFNLSHLCKKGYNKSNELEKILYLFVCKDINELDKIYKGDKLMSDVKKEVHRVCDGMDWSMLFYDPKELEKRCHEEALKEKFNEGMKQGLEQGINERNTQIVKNMLEANLTKEAIMSYLGINEEEYNRIINTKE